MTLRCVKHGLCLWHHIATSICHHRLRTFSLESKKKKFANWTLVSGEGDRDVKFKLERETTIVEVFRAGL